MRTFVIGDLQGCYDPLVKLLEKIEYNPNNDHLWFVGDVINRGPKSLECLRFVKETVLAGRGKMVLGNHDFHLLAAYSGLEKYKSKSDTLDDILEAEDCDQLVDWLRHQPLIVKHPVYEAAMVHAGIPPQWTVTQAQAYASEVTEHLQNDQWQVFLREHLFGNQSDQWQAHISGWERIRYIVNAFVRMRLCDERGQLELKEKGTPKPNDNSPFQPWFLWPNRKNKDVELYFGHWSTLGSIDAYGVHATDTGCLWGRQLTAYCIEEKKRYCIDCEASRKPKKKKK